MVFCANISDAARPSYPHVRPCDPSHCLWPTLFPLRARKRAPRPVIRQLTAPPSPPTAHVSPRTSVPLGTSSMPTAQIARRGPHPALARCPPFSRNSCWPPACTRYSARACAVNSPPRPARTAGKFRTGHEGSSIQPRTRAPSSGRAASCCWRAWPLGCIDKHGLARAPPPSHRCCDDGCVCVRARRWARNRATLACRHARRAQAHAPCRRRAGKLAHGSLSLSRRACPRSVRIIEPRRSGGERRRGIRRPRRARRRAVQAFART